LVGRFVGLALLAMLLQFLLLGFLLSGAVKEIAAGNGHLAPLMTTIAIKMLAFSFLVLVPMLVVLGVVLTAHVAGPVYRFETYLGSLVRGERPGPCKIRKGDELQSLCDAINELSSKYAQLEEQVSAAEPQQAPERRKAS